MIEGAPKKGQQHETIDLVEGSDGVWRMEQEKASAKVDELISSIDGFEQMSPQDKIERLKSELAGITDNADRFMVEPLAKKIKAIELYEEYARGIEKLGTTIDTHA